MNKVQGTTLKIKKSLFERLQNVERLINSHIFFFFDFQAFLQTTGGKPSKMSSFTGLLEKFPVTGRNPSFSRNPSLSLLRDVKFTGLAIPWLSM